MTVPTIHCALQQASAALGAVSDTSLLDAELLLAFVLHQSRSYLYAFGERLLTADEWQAFQAVISRREQGEPVAYIVGHREFWSLDLWVTQATLIPRPETEVLVEAVLEQMPKEAVLQVADLGTGSGAIALALATERPHWRLIALEQSAAALAVAMENAKRLQINNVFFQQASWQELLSSPVANLDAIVSNPPYLAESEWAAYRHGLAYEPLSALLSGPDGLDAIREIVALAKLCLKLGGSLLIEHGFAQAVAVRSLFAQAGFVEVRSIRDFAGHERVVCGIKGIETSDLPR